MFGIIHKGLHGVEFVEHASILFGDEQRGASIISCRLPVVCREERDDKAAGEEDTARGLWGRVLRPVRPSSAVIAASRSRDRVFSWECRCGRRGEGGIRG